MTRCIHRLMEHAHNQNAVWARTIEHNVGFVFVTPHVRTNLCGGAARIRVLCKCLKNAFKPSVVALRLTWTKPVCGVGRNFKDIGGDTL